MARPRVSKQCLGRIHMKNVGQHLEMATATSKLTALAEKPYDLRSQGALVIDGRMRRYICQNTSFRLLYATERIDDQVLDSLQALADECELVKQFQAMRRGAVINRVEGYESENRQVLHTACRDIFIDQPAAPAATGQARVELEKLRAFLYELETGAVLTAAGEPFHTIVHIGIGGSDLGPRSIYESLQAFSRQGRKVFFISNVDPDDAARVMDQTDLSHTLINIVSKSGTTLETLTNEQLVIERLRTAGLDPARHCIAVTGQGSPMDNPEKYLRSFYMYDYIGGRYSSTSMVGAVSLGFCLGYDQFIDFLRGAAEVDVEAEQPDIRKNLPLLLALLGIWNHNFLGAASLAVLPYSQALHRFPAHLQQCDMESNGKSIHRDGSPVRHTTGPVIWGEPGTNGQHAFYQLLHQGTEIVPVEFIGFTESQYGKDSIVAGTSSQQKLLANLLAQSLALAAGQSHSNPNKVFPGNRPSCLLLADRLTPKTMGALLAIYEAKIAFQGFCWGINSFDQEGVQLGKVLATRILDQFKNPERVAEGVEKELVQAAFFNV
jgi:glucose-6-phosphate isomerase